MSRIVRSSSRLLMCCLLATLAPCLAGAVPDPGEVRFNRDVRPILSDKCFKCHGPDEDERKARLRFDTREGAFRTRRGRASIVPGDAAKSELYRRVAAEDEDDRMPPPDSGKSLTAEEIETLRRWIDEGARWEGHWSLIAPRRPELPSVSRADWPRNPIDYFVLARQEEAGLSPSPEADRRTLIRRVTLDLTGLPPTLEEVEAFLSDTSPEAYRKLVDRLLESAHYGEHMARSWLDAVRYGDTHGLHLDNYREMWPYRDWVIGAFNANMPWDQFTIRNLAGDLLPDATLDDRIASGFNRAHVTTSEGGSIPEEVYVRNVVDRVSTVGTVFLGLTTGCAVCHDHKFDPFTMKDFYSMFAFFNSLDANPLDGNDKAYAPVVRVPSEEEQRRLDELDHGIARLGEELGAPRPDLDQAQALWEADWAKRKTEFWRVLDPARASSSGGATLTRQDDLSVLASGENPDKDVFTITARTDEVGIAALRLEALPDPSLTGGSSGRSENGNAVLSEIEVEVRPAANLAAAATAAGDVPAAGSAEPRAIKLVSATADHSQQGFPVTAAIDGKVDPGAGWATEGHARKETRTAVFTADAPFGFPGGTEITVRLRFESRFARHTLGRVRLAVSSSWEPGLSPEIVELLTKPDAPRTDAQKEALRAQFRRTHSPEWKKLEDELASARKEKDALEASLPTTLVSKERDEPKPAYLLRRGQYDQPDKDAGPLPPAVPASLPPLPEGAPANRLGFAEWLVAPSHPLLARVTVNRIWAQCFGRGIVETSEDFGSQGAWPTHPDLLDWLAVEFRESGWDVKRLMRMIVTSATYRQRSYVTPELLARDPRNRLLARGPRFRLDAEVLRDQALAVSGLLVNRLGGPPVKPPQPEGLWKAVAYVGSNTGVFKADRGHEKVHRRSIYTFWKRTAPPPEMNTFDAPSREACTVRRERTNTPLQALLLLNDPQYVEAARYLARRVVREGGRAPSDRAAHMFTLATQRSPETGELDALVGLYRDRVEFYSRSPDAARELLSIGDAPADLLTDASEEAREAAAELAAWTLVANAVLNLDEVITKE